MTEQQQPEQQQPEQAQQQPTQQPATSRERRRPAETNPGQYAAYDKTYGRFLPGTHDSKDAARAAGKKAGVEDLEVRDVSEGLKASRRR